MFTRNQEKALSSKLDPRFVRRREGKFDYIEGWHAIAEANRVFGFDGWSRRTVDLRVTNEWQTKNKDAVGYLARVEIEVYGEGPRVVTRHGVGFGSGFGHERHESAAKEAETDATKRALSTFGWCFGLALYDERRAHVDEPPSQDQRAEIGGLLRDLGHQTREEMTAALEQLGFACVTRDTAGAAIEALRELVLVDEARQHQEGGAA